MKQLISQIEQWAEDRNLIKGSTPEKQMLKLMEEFGELCGGIAKNKPEVIKDSIGDCFVVITILNKQVGNSADAVNVSSGGHGFYWDLNDVIADISSYISEGCLYPLNVVADLQDCADWYELDFKECLQHAYNQIKDRKGKMIDGVFVKEEDLMGKVDKCS